MPAKLILTNGDLKFDLLKLNLTDWTPAAPSVKNDGIWMDSPISEGRRIAMKKLGNVIDAFTFQPSGFGQNIPIEDIRTLGQLLEQAVSYFEADWQVQPVWIEARADCEEESVKALIYDYRTPGLDNPFEPPFSNVSGLSTVEDFVLILEHSMWMDLAPGDEACVRISAQGNIATVDAPGASNDDARIKSDGTISLVTTALTVGMDTTDSYSFGVRFLTVAIPAGSTILRARIAFVAQASNSYTPVNARLIGQRSIAPTVFTTYANFQTRIRTDAFVDWFNIPTVTAGLTYFTPDIAPVVQEIIDLPGWVSGNNIVIFCQDLANIARRQRAFSSWDDAALEPQLQIEYIGTTTVNPVGHAPTCEPYVYIPNHYQKSQITHIFRFDASVPSYTNILGLAKPTALLPNPVAAGDMLYFVVDQTALNNGNLDNFVFNINPGWDIGAGGSYRWEYLSNPVGPVYSILAVADNTDGLQQPGVNSVSFEKPSNMQIGVVNGVTGWIFRLNIIAVGGAPTPPSQAGLEVFSAIAPFALVGVDEVKGDRFAPIHIRARNLSDGSGFLTPPDHDIKSLIVSTRSTSRGADFVPFLNFSSVQLLNGQSVAATLGTFSIITNDPMAPTGSCGYFNPAGAVSLTGAGYIKLDQALAQQYMGRFRLFMRCRHPTASGGADGDFSAQIRISNSGIEYYRSEELFVERRNEFAILDFGAVEIPPSVPLFATAPPTDTIFDIYLANSNAAPGDLYVYDIIVMPTDEFAAEYTDPVGNPNNSYLSTNGGLTRLLDIDALTVPKIPVAAILRTNAGDLPYLLRWVEIQPEFPFLQHHAEQKIFFLSLGMETTHDSYTAEPGINLNIQVFVNARYSWLKGDEQ